MKTQSLTKVNKKRTNTFLILLATGVFPLHSFLQYSMMSISGATLSLYSVKIEYLTFQDNCYIEQHRKSIEFLNTLYHFKITSVPNKTGSTTCHY